MAPISGCAAGVAGILEAWHDMWFTPAGSQSPNKNDTCVSAAILLTSSESPAKHILRPNLYCNTYFILFHRHQRTCNGKETQTALWQTESTTIAFFILVTICPSMLPPYLRMGGLTTMRNSPAVRKQGLLSQNSSSEDSAAFTRENYQVSSGTLEMHTHIHSRFRD